MTPQQQLSSDEARGESREKYSKWHRVPNLPYWCYMVDMDWIEMRVRNGELVPVAFIEVITYRGKNIEKANLEKPLTRAKFALCKYCEDHSFSTYVVWFNPNELGTAKFLVQRVGKKPMLMNEAEYKRFLMNL